MRAVSIDSDLATLFTFTPPPIYDRTADTGGRRGAAGKAAEIGEVQNLADGAKPGSEKWLWAWGTATE